MTQEVVENAIVSGYRHIDTAAAYNNEEGVGRGIRSSGVPRADLFVTTKLRNGEQGRVSPAQALRASLERLQLNYVDLYLIHWPSPARDAYIDSWRSLEELRQDGLARAIGVSNFLPHHLDRLREATGVTPAVNQLEIHPRYQQRDVQSMCARRGIAIEAYSPLGRGAALLDPVVRDIAAHLGSTPAQVVLRWHLQHGRVAIPKTTSVSRMTENLASVDFELSADEIRAIDRLDAGERLGGDPDTFEISQIR